MSPPYRPRRRTRFGVVIVHYGPPEPTLACLAAVASDRSRVARRIVVVDNSDDLDPGALRATAGGFLLHHPCPDNPGFGGGANRGAELLLAGDGADALLILNGDVEIESGFLEAAAAALEEGKSALGGPLYLDDQHQRLWYAGGDIRSWSGTVHQETTPEAAEQAREIDFLTGASLVVSAEAWREVGGFDERFFLYNEDVDLSLRLRRAGYAMHFVPGMVAVHRLGSATGSAERSPLYLESITATRLLPFPGRLHRLYLAVLHSGWVALRSFLLLVRGPASRWRRIQALLRGQRRALATAWRGKMTLGDDDGSGG